MSKRDERYTIYFHKSRKRLTVSKAEFDTYYRGVNAFRRTQQNHGQCICPQSKWLQCDMDCLTCTYHTSGAFRSLDEPHLDSDGNALPWLDRLQTELPELQSPSTEEIVMDKLEAEELLSRLQELMPQAIAIGKLRLQGLSEEAIAEKIGVGRKTYAYRLKKVKALLKAEFPDFF